MVDPNKPFFTADEVGRMLCVTAQTVINLVNAGRLSHHRIGDRLYRFAKADVIEFLDRNRQHSRQPGQSG